MATSSKDSSSKSARRSERRTPLLVSCIAAAIGLASCNNPLEEDDPTLDMRLVNLVTDSPTLRFSIDDADMSTAAFETVTGFHAARPGSHSVSLEAIRPVDLAGDSEDPISLGEIAEQTFEGELSYTVFAYGTMDDPHAFVMGTRDQQDEVETDDHMVWQIVNAASNAQSVDVYVTAPEAKITSPQLVATLDFTEHSESMDLLLFPRDDRIDEDAALFVDLTIEVRARGSNDVLFTSSKIRLGEQTRSIFAVVPNGDPGPASVKLMRVDPSATQHVDPRDNAEVRFVHVSTDSPPLDVIRAAVQRQTLAQNVAFRDRSDYVQVANGETDLIATPSADPATFLFLEEFNAAAHRSFSIYAVGTAADVDGLIVTDSRHSVPTQARFRFLHAAPSIDDEDAVDIYVTPPGQEIDFEDEPAEFRKFTSVVFPNATDYLTLEAGDYEVHFVAAGTSRVLLDSAPFQVVNGDVTTYVLHDSETGALELLPVDDARR